MSKSRYLSLAYQASGMALGALSLALILLPEVRVRATHLCFTAALLTYLVLGVYVDRLRGLTLKALHEEIKDGRRAPMSSWHTVVMILMLAALWFAGPSVG